MTIAAKIVLIIGFVIIGLMTIFFLCVMFDDRYRVHYWVDFQNTRRLSVRTRLSIQISMPWQKIVALILLAVALFNVANLVYYNGYSSDAKLLQRDIADIAQAMAKGDFLMENKSDEELAYMVDTINKKAKRSPIAFNMNTMAANLSMHYTQDLGEKVIEAMANGTAKEDIDMSNPILAKQYKQHAEQATKPVLKQFYLDLAMFVGESDEINFSAMEVTVHLILDEVLRYWRLAILHTFVVTACMIILMRHFPIKPYEEDKMAQFIEKLKNKFTKRFKPSIGDWLA